MNKKNQICLGTILHGVCFQVSSHCAGWQNQLSDWSILTICSSLIDYIIQTILPKVKMKVFFLPPLISLRNRTLISMLQLRNITQIFGWCGYLSEMSSIVLCIWTHCPQLWGLILMIHPQCLPSFWYYDPT